MQSLKSNSAYKAQAERAVKAAQPLIAAGKFKDAAKAVTNFYSGATPNKLMTMRFSPREVALRALGLRFVRSYPRYGGANATYISGHTQVYAHKSGWTGEL